MLEHTLPIHRMTWLPSQTVWVLAIVSGWLWAGELSTAAQPPNVILILADDLGAKELGCYGTRSIIRPTSTGWRRMEYALKRSLRCHSARRLALP